MIKEPKFKHNEKVGFTVFGDAEGFSISKKVSGYVRSIELISSDDRIFFDYVLTDRPVVNDTYASMNKLKTWRRRENRLGKGDQ